MLAAVVVVGILVAIAALVAKTRADTAPLMGIWPCDPFIMIDKFGGPSWHVWCLRCDGRIAVATSEGLANQKLRYHAREHGVLGL
jgi:hypothetical protein